MSQLLSFSYISYLYESELLTDDSVTVEEYFMPDNDNIPVFNDSYAFPCSYMAYFPVTAGQNLLLSYLKKTDDSEGMSYKMAYCMNIYNIIEPADQENFSKKYSAYQLIDKDDVNRRKYTATINIEDLGTNWMYAIGHLNNDTNYNTENSTYLYKSDFTHRDKSGNEITDYHDCGFLNISETYTRTGNMLEHDILLFIGNTTDGFPGVLNHYANVDTSIVSSYIYNTTNWNMSYWRYTDDNYKLYNPNVNVFLLNTAASNYKLYVPLNLKYEYEYIGDTPKSQVIDINNADIVSELPQNEFNGFQWFPVNFKLNIKFKKILRLNLYSAEKINTNNSLNIDLQYGNTRLTETFNLYDNTGSLWTPTTKIMYNNNQQIEVSLYKQTLQIENYNDIGNIDIQDVKIALSSLPATPENYSPFIAVNVDNSSKKYYKLIGSTDKAVRAIKYSDDNIGDILLPPDLSESNGYWIYNDQDNNIFNENELAFIRDYSIYIYPENNHDDNIKYDNEDTDHQESTLSENRSIINNIPKKVLATYICDKILTIENAHKTIAD